jgi:hypothetical protein
MRVKNLGFLREGIRCRLTDKFAEKGSYASKGENGDFMCQSCQCKQTMTYLTNIVRVSIIIS